MALYMCCYFFISTGKLLAEIIPQIPLFNILCKTHLSTIQKTNLLRKPHPTSSLMAEKLCLAIRDTYQMYYYVFL